MHTQQQCAATLMEYDSKTNIKRAVAQSEDKMQMYVHGNHLPAKQTSKEQAFVQLRQIKSGIITWVRTNSPTAPDASVTAKAVCACQLPE